MSGYKPDSVSPASSPLPDPRGRALVEEQFDYLIMKICERLHGTLTRQILHDVIIPNISTAYPTDALILRTQAMEFYATLTDALGDVVLGVINGQLDRHGILPLTAGELAFRMSIIRGGPR